MSKSSFRKQLLSDGETSFDRFKDFPKFECPVIEYTYTPVAEDELEVLDLNSEWVCGDGFIEKNYGVVEIPITFEQIRANNYVISVNTGSGAESYGVAHYFKPYLVVRVNTQITSGDYQIFLPYYQNAAIFKDLSGQLLDSIQLLDQIRIEIEKNILEYIIPPTLNAAEKAGIEIPNQKIVGSRGNFPITYNQVGFMGWKDATTHGLKYGLFTPMQMDFFWEGEK